MTWVGEGVGWVGWGGQWIKTLLRLDVTEEMRKVALELFKSFSSVHGRSGG